MPAIIDSVLRAGEGKILRKLKRIADQVNSIEEDFAALSDAELRAMTDEFRQRYADGETLDDLLPEAFATVREAARRTLGQRHFDVQLMGGAALHLGNIAEMKTGEGKTLTVGAAGLPERADRQRRARRHGQRLPGQARLGVDGPGAPLPRPGGRRDPGPDAARRSAARQYEADITYGTNNEFGFDYLRDNMAWGLEECVQRGHHFAIVDEVDSILIDEARTPLIISGPAEQSARWYTEFAKIAPRLRRGEDGEGDYEVDEKKKTVGILETGVEKVEDWLGIDNLYDPVNTPLVSFLNNAIKAKELYKKDKDYVVVNGEVLIVDEFTGRMLHGRRYNEGMHQAIEAKEGVQIQNENQTLATITLQNYFRLYDKLAGMTGTAMTEANEFAPDLQARRGADPDQHADDPGRPGGRRLPDGGGQVRGGRRGHRGAARGRPAGAGRHHQRGEVRDAVPAAQAERRAARGAEREVPRAGGGDHRPGRAQGRGHGGDQHGRPRHRHHARRQPRVHRRPRAAPARAVPGGHAGGLRGGLARGGGEGQGGGGRGARGSGGRRRPVRARHRAARVAPDRQPAARPVRPPGRPRASPGSTCPSKTT